MREIKEDPGEAESADAEEGDESRRRGDAVFAQGVGENFQKDVEPRQKTDMMAMPQRSRKIPVRVQRRQRRRFPAP